MRKSIWIAVALAGMLTGLVFGSSSTAEEPTRLRIINGLGRWDIHYVYVSPGSSSSWGEDQLGDNQVLRVGESEMWTLDPGTYDLRVKDQDNDTYSRYNVCIARAMTVEWRVTLADLDSD